MKKVTLTLCLLLGTWGSTQAPVKPSESQLKTQALVESCQLSSRGSKYCTEIVQHLMKSAKANNIDALILATTAYHESRFSMASSPQMGIMQFTRSTWRGNFGPKGKLLKGLDPWNAAHNILAGGAYLRGHLLASRGSVRGMWLGYNRGHRSTDSKGNYISTSYTRECERTLKRLRTWSLDQIKKYLKSGKEL